MSADHPQPPPPAGAEASAARPARHSRLAAIPALLVALAGLLAATLLPNLLRGRRPSAPAGKRIERIVSLSPSTTETVFALGLGDRLVGVSSACDWPPDARLLPKMGDYGSPAVESILAARPDLVLVSGRHLGAQLADIERAGIPIYSAPDGTLEEIAGGFEELGRLAGAEAAGRRLASDFRAAFDHARRSSEGAPEAGRPRVYLEISYGPVWAIGRGNFADELVRAAGGRNVLAGFGEGYIQPPEESIIASDPEVVVLASMAPDGRAAASRVALRPGWSGVSAVRSGRVWADIPADLLLRPGPRLVDGLMLLGTRIASTREEEAPR